MIRVASWPHWYAPNRYLPLFYEALARHDVRHLPGVPLELRALTDPRLGLSAVHLHWAYPYWRDGDRGVLRQLRRVQRLHGLLRGLRDHGLKVLWTVHNLEPHEDPRLPDRLGYDLLHRQVDLRIFHSAWARDQATLGRRSPGGETIVMPHGSYVGALPKPRSAAATRRRLGVAPGTRMLLAFGQVRPYKGFQHALRAVLRLRPGAYHLVIAGRPVAGAGDALQGAAAPVPHLTTMLRDLSEQELTDLLGAADAVLLPYLKSSGSGALLHALTAGKPVIASDLPCFREVLDPEALAGVLVPPGRPDAIADGIESCFEVDPGVRQEAALRLADRYDWTRLVGPVADWLHRNARPGP